MLPELLIRGVLNGLLGARPKRSHRALRFLTGGGRGGWWSNPQALLTAAGLAWGVVETLQSRPAATAPSSGAGAPGASPSPAGTTMPPPLPQTATAATPASSPDALRVVRLAISAAHADGSLNERERAAVLRQARDAGTGDLIERELQSPRPLAEIVAGVNDPAEAATLYVLAFTILRADEQVTGAERIYLAQLAHLLRLDPATVGALEQDTGERIDALGDQGQPGG
jgi:uncharacterized membrane protein YebE (DUF533 family)